MIAKGCHPDCLPADSLATDQIVALGVVILGTLAFVAAVGVLALREWRDRGDS